jgi:hypothetical protein
VQPGQETNFVVSKTEYSKLEEPYSDCVSDQHDTKQAEFIRSTIETKGLYTQKRCIRSCAIKKNKENNQRVCSMTNDTSFDCLNQQRNISFFFDLCSEFW